MMTAKEYLMQVGILDCKIKILIHERDDIHSIALCNQSLQLQDNKVQSSGSSDVMARAVERYVDIERELNGLIDKYVDLRWRIVKEIQSLNNPQHSELLYLRYVDCKRLEDIACIMRKRNGDMYSYDHIKRLHGYALANFSRRILKMPQ